MALSAVPGHNVQLLANELHPIWLVYRDGSGEFYLTCFFIYLFIYLCESRAIVTCTGHCTAICEKLELRFIHFEARFLSWRPSIRVVL